MADPRAVGDGLVLITAGLAAGVVLPIVGMLCAGAAAQSGRGAVSIVVVEQAVTIAAVAVLISGCIGCWLLRPGDRGPLQKAARRAVILAGLGTLVLGAGLLAMIMPDPMTALSGSIAGGTGLLLGLGGVRRVLVEAGRRCRLFRTATLRRQRIPTLMVAAALAAALLAGARVARLAGAETLDLTLGALGLTMTSMLAVGLIYLVANAVWIRRDLRKPPPRLIDLLSE